MTKDYLWRLALVINTGNSKFLDNLVSVIIYTIYVSENAGVYITKDELKKQIEDTIQLEFSEEEIFQALTYGEKFFYVANSQDVHLTESGRKKIHIEKQEEFNQLISEFISLNEFDFTLEQTLDLLYRFLFECIESNIEALLNIIQNTDINSFIRQLEDFSIEEKRLINAFLIWDNIKKNEMLFEIISFAIDYCRLTVRKDAANFNTILQGKKFYLDSNIIFRLMGLNNSNRKETIIKFVEKCKRAGIKLIYTSETRKEINESIHYHIERIKKSLQGYNGSGSSIERLYTKMESEDGFFNEYFKWASENKLFGKYEEFEQYLRRMFYSSVSDMSMEENTISEISEDLLKDYIDYKNGNIRKENALYDLKNIKFIEKLRSRNVGEVGWNTSLYLISADHKLISWSTEKINSTNPIVVLPSVWYAILLKVYGRANDDMVAFVEFVKLRYVQDNAIDTVDSIVYNVCEKTSDGVLQDLLFDQICNDNQSFNIIGSTEDYLEEYVESQYDILLKHTQEERFNEGSKSGEAKGKLEGRSIGEKIGWINSELHQIDDEIIRETKKIRKRNILICCFSVGGYILTIFLILKFAATNFMEENETLSLFIKALAYILPSGIIYWIISSVFPMDAGTIRENVNLKYEEKRNDLEQQLKSLENE